MVRAPALCLREKIHPRGKVKLEMMKYLQSCLSDSPDPTIVA
jgi:hypothetical protein